MTTLLKLFEDLASDPATKARFAAAPDRFLVENGFGDLPPEDVAEALTQAADSFPPALAAEVDPGLGLESLASTDLELLGLNGVDDYDTVWDPSQTSEPSPDPGTVENGTVENGTVENGTVENGTVENGTVENGTDESGTDGDDGFLSELRETTSRDTADQNGGQDELARADQVEPAEREEPASPAESLPPEEPNLGSDPLTEPIEAHDDPFARDFDDPLWGTSSVEEEELDPFGPLDGIDGDVGDELI